MTFAAPPPIVAILRGVKPDEVVDIAAALVGAGVGYHEALNFTYLLAFLLYLTVFCWAFATRDLARAWLILAGGAALMTGAAWLLRDIVEVTG